MTAPTPEDALRDAIQEHLRAMRNEDRIITAYVLATESVTLENATDETHVDLIGTGSWATRVGLAHVLREDVTGGDDD